MIIVDQFMKIIRLKATMIIVLLEEYYKISYSLVVILKLDSISEVQYKKIMIISDE